MISSRSGSGATELVCHCRRYHDHVRLHSDQPRNASALSGGMSFCSHEPTPRRSTRACRLLPHHHHLISALSSSYQLHSISRPTLAAGLQLRPSRLNSVFLGTSPVHFRRHTRPRMIDHVAYPHIIDAIFAHAPYDTLVVLRCTCRTWRDLVDRRLVRHLAIIEGYTLVSKLHSRHHPLPFPLAFRSDLHSAVQCIDIERSCEEWDFRPPCPIAPYLSPAIVRNYGGITPFSVGDFPRGKTLVQIAHDRFTHFGSGPSRWALHLCHSVERVVVHFQRPPYDYQNRELFYCLISLSTEVREVVLLLNTEDLRCRAEDGTLRMREGYDVRSVEQSLRLAVGLVCADRVKEVLQRVESRPPNFVIVDSAPNIAEWLADEEGVTPEDAVLRHVRRVGCRWSDDEVREVARDAISFVSHAAYRDGVGAAEYELEWGVDRDV